MTAFSVIIPIIQNISVFLIYNLSIVILILIVNFGVLLFYIYRMHLQAPPLPGNTGKWIIYGG